MKHLFFLVILVEFLFLILLLPLLASAEVVACKREMFTHCLNSSSPTVSVKTNFTYTDANGVARTDKVTRLVGCLNPDLEACSLKALRTDADRIPTAVLMAEHKWMVFNLQQMGQQEVWACYKEYEGMQRLLKEPCLITDTRCSFSAATIRNLSKYWIEFNAVDAVTWWKTQPPTREDFLLHFKTGIDGLERILAYREQCRYDLNIITNKVKAKYRIR